MIGTLTELDTSLLIWIHTHVQNGFFDWLMPIAREKWTWLPLYVLLLAFLLMNFGKRGALWILLLVFTIALTDTVSSKVIKYEVKRLRPCHTEQVAPQLNQLVSCGGYYSFTSSHAANHFAMATFLWMTLGLLIRKWRWLFFFWAGLIAFAQVYVGVHFPLDVIAGGLLGICIGGMIAWYYRYRWKPWSILPEEPVTAADGN